MPRESTENISTEARRASAEIIIAAQDAGYIDVNLMWLVKPDTLLRMPNGTIKGFQSGVVRSAEDVNEEIRYWRKYFPDDFRQLIADFRESLPPKRKRKRRIRKDAAQINPEARMKLTGMPACCWSVYTYLVETQESNELESDWKQIGRGASMTDKTVYRAMGQLSEAGLISWVIPKRGKWSIRVCL